MQLKMMMIVLVFGAGLCGSGAVALSSQPRLRSSLFKREESLDLVARKEVAPLRLLELNAENASNSSGGVLPDLANIEHTLASLEADKKAGKVTPGMGNFIETVTKMIDKEMIPAMMKQHGDSKRLLRSVKTGFLTCSNVRKLSRAPIKALAVSKGSTRGTHMSCRREEDKRFVVKAACQVVVAEKLKTRKAECKAFQDFKMDPNSEAAVCSTRGRPEPYSLWIKRNQKYFKKRLETYRRLKGACYAARRDWRRAFIPCAAKTRKWAGERRKCVFRQQGLEVSSCSLAKKLKDTCSVYETCYDAQKARYLKLKPKIMVQERDRKGEWRALMRIKCLLTGVFGGGKEDALLQAVDDDDAEPTTVKVAAIETCKNKTHSTKHLDLVYPPIPGKADCGKLPPIPATKLFAKVEYSALPLNTKAARSMECVLEPGGGVLMGQPMKSRKDKCRVENGWLQAQNGGSCLLAGRRGRPVYVNYKRARFTKYRFTVKMDEVNPRDGQSAGGGFSVCNLVRYSSFANDKDPSINFVDSKVPARWGYHLAGGFKGYRNTQSATCKDLLVNYTVWGRPGKGIDVGKYTGGKMKWIGCMGDGCAANSFYCNDIGDGLVFGSPGTLRGLLGNTVPTRHYGCCSRRNPNSVCNAMDKAKDITALCRQLGYSRGTVLASRRTNWCPEVSFEKGGWASDFVNSHGYGNKFRCQGATAKALYTNKNYYKAAEPKSGKPLQWDLTMEYKAGRYQFRSLKIEGRDFSGFLGSKTTCPMTNKFWGMTPRITAAKTGKVAIKDFRVFQGNSLNPKRMRQTVGQGINRHTSKAALLRAAKRAARGMPTCSSNGRPRTWRRTRSMTLKGGRQGSILQKSNRYRNSWYDARYAYRRTHGAVAVMPRTTSVKLRIIQRRYQHVKFGLTPSSKPNLGFPGGRAIGIYPGGRLYVWGYGRRTWRFGDTVEMRIQGRYYCAFHNNRRLKCWRGAPKRGVAQAQVHIYERINDGVQLARVCTKRR